MTFINKWCIRLKDVPDREIETIEFNDVLNGFERSLRF